MPKKLKYHKETKHFRFDEKHKFFRDFVLNIIIIKLRCVSEFGN